MTAREVIFELESYYELKYSKEIQEHLALWLKGKNKFADEVYSK